MPRKATKPFYDLIRERTELAVIYAEDGAYGRAAEILEEIAKMTREHYERVKL